MVDYFSDTNTNPSPAMRQYMAQAPVGNEVAGEDPTVNALVDKTKALLGKEAAMFLPSGAMCNSIAFRVLCQRPGDIILLDKSAHPVHYSAGMVPSLANASLHLLNGQRGIFSVQEVRNLLAKPKGRNLPAYRVIAVEQTTNYGGGAIWALEDLNQLCHLAHQEGLFTHMDGARLWHAVVETGIAAADYAKNFDAVWVDFSKGLGAPMGAVLAGSQSLIEEAWYYKFQQGGGMHQAGILAAGCLYGLTHNMRRLKDIHAITQGLAHELAKLDFICIDPKQVVTNIIIFSLQHPTMDAPEFAQKLLKHAIRVLAIDQDRIRMILHLDITAQDIQRTLVTFKKIGYKEG